MLGKTNETFVKNLSGELERREWGVPDLAKASGLSASGIYGWLSEARKWPSAENLERAAKALDRPVAWFFLDDSDRVEPSDDDLVRMLAKRLNVSLK